MRESIKGVFTMLYRSAFRSIALVAAVTLSATASASTQIPMDRTITFINTYPQGALIIFTPAFANTDGCTASGSSTSVLIEWTTDANQKNLYVAALAAMHSGAKVGFGTSGCGTYLVGVPLVYRVDVAP
jgi:hypothetical protein